MNSPIVWEETNWQSLRHKLLFSRDLKRSHRLQFSNIIKIAYPFFLRKVLQVRASSLLEDERTMKVFTSFSHNYKKLPCQDARTIR